MKTQLQQFSQLLYNISKYEISISEAKECIDYCFNNYNNIEELQEKYNHLITNFSNPPKDQFLMDFLSNILMK